MSEKVYVTLKILLKGKDLLKIEKAIGFTSKLFYVKSITFQLYFV